MVVFSLIVGLLSLVGIGLASEGAHWSYAGETGPDNWGELSEEYALCGTGMEQSPIDIPSTAPLNADNIAFSYQPTALNIVNNGHAIQVNYDEGSSIELDGMTYNLEQFHIHGLSEHTFDRTHMDLEIHLVHKTESGDSAVVGFFVTRGAENPAFAPVWENLPPEEGEPETIADVTVNVDELLPAQRTYYRYDGSLTTPACDEGVKWIVLNTPVELSDAQVNAFQQIYHNTYRPTQPFNDRQFLVTE